MEAPGASDLRRDLIMASSDVAPSDGRDLSRSEALRGHIAICIGRAKQGLGMELSGASDRHQMRNQDQPRDLHQTATVLPDLPLTLAMRGTFWSAGSPSDGRRKWSHHDRANADQTTAIKAEP